MDNALTCQCPGEGVLPGGTIVCKEQHEIALLKAAYRAVQQSCPGLARVQDEPQRVCNHPGAGFTMLGQAGHRISDAAQEGVATTGFAQIAVSPCSRRRFGCLRRDRRSGNEHHWKTGLQALQHLAQDEAVCVRKTDVHNSDRDGMACDSRKRFCCTGGLEDAVTRDSKVPGATASCGLGPLDVENNWEFGAGEWPPGSGEFVSPSS
jgi:hypothetical protein